MKSQSRNFYYSGIFFITLSILTTTFLCINYLQHGLQIYFLASYPSWLVLVTIIDVISASILLKYYHVKKYRFSFFTGTIYLAASVSLYTILYIMLVFKKLNALYIPVCIFLLVTSLAFYITLIFSNSGKRPLLKFAGILGLILAAILLTSLLWNNYFPSLHLRPVFESINFWTSWCSCIVSGLLLGNLIRELRETKNPARNSVNYSLIVSAPIVFVSVFILGYKLYSESQLVGYPHQISEKARGIASLFEAKHFVNADGDSLRYRFMKPLDYNPQKQYPLVVLLHHGGVHGTDNIIQVEGSAAPFLSTYVNKRKYPAFLFVPQCPQNMSWGDPLFSQLVFEAINDFEKQFSVDIKRRYVMGISGGGYGSWYFIGIHPEMFAAAIPMSGGLDPGLSSNMANVAVWAFHGDKDALAPVSSTRSIIAGIKKAGGHPRYTEFPNAGHNIDGQVQQIPGLLDWLFSQKRE